MKLMNFALAQTSLKFAAASARCVKGDVGSGEIVGIVNRIAEVEHAHTLYESADSEIELVFFAHDRKSRGCRFVKSFGRVLDKSVVDFLIGLPGIEYDFHHPGVGDSRVVLSLCSQGRDSHRKH